MTSANQKHKLNVMMIMLRGDSDIFVDFSVYKEKELLLEEMSFQVMSHGAEAVGGQTLKTLYKGPHCSCCI